MNTIVDSLKNFWNSLGPLGPCIALFLTGCLMILGFIFNWRWLYPGDWMVRDLSPSKRRALLLIGGIIVIICSIIFYVFRNSLTWNY